MAKKDKKQNPRKNLYPITCNDCGEKGHYYGKSEFSKQTKVKEGPEEFIKTKQGKSRINPSDGGGEQNKLVNDEDASYGLMMDIPTDEWDNLPSTGIIFYRTHHKKSCRWNPSLINSNRCHRATNSISTQCVWEIPS